MIKYIVLINDPRYGASHYENHIHSLTKLCNEKEFFDTLEQAKERQKWLDIYWGLPGEHSIFEISVNIKPVSIQNTKPGRKIRMWECTCEACPTQYNFWTEQDEYIYFRFRHGRLIIEENQKSIYSECVSNDLDGSMNFDMVKSYMEKAGFVFP